MKGMKVMFFFIVLILGLLSTLIFIKAKSSWARWIPAIVFLIGAIIIGGKAMLFPAPEMAALGEIVYFMIFGAATIGAAIGGLTIHLWNKNRRK